MVTREVHRSSLRRLICPAHDHLIFLTFLIISMTFVLSLTQMLVFLSLYVMLSILLSVLIVCMYIDLNVLFMLQGKLGEALISLCYQPTVGRITVVVMKCRDLKSKDINGYSGKCLTLKLSVLFIKLFLLPRSSSLHRLHRSWKFQLFLYHLIVRLIHEAILSLLQLIRNFAIYYCFSSLPNFPALVVFAIFYGDFLVTRMVKTGEGKLLWWYLFFTTLKQLVHEQIFWPAHVCI